MKKETVLVKISPETEGQIKEAMSLKMPTVVLKTPAEYEAMGNFLKEVKTRSKRLEGELKSITDPLNIALKNVRALFKPALDALSVLEKSAKAAINDYDFRAEQERRKLEAELRAKQEQERKRLEVQAEALRAQGKEKQAEVKEAKAEMIAAKPVIIASNVPKIDGVSKRVIWRYRIVDENAIPREYLMPNDKKIGEVIRATNGTVKIPGIEAYQENIISSRQADY